MTPISILVVTGTGTGVGKTAVTAAVAALAAGAGQLGRAAFCRAAAEGLGPSLGGRFDPAGFRKEHTAAREAP